MRRLSATSAMLDGEGIVYDYNGMPNFEYIHSKQYDREVALVAFDLLELNGEDVRPQPLIQRKTWLEKLVSKEGDGIEFSEHLEGDGADIFRAACRLGHEGVIAKRKDLPYESGRSKCWLKIKNPDSPAATRIEDGTL
jgi:bifunctional non-homologous end joining protein LigD